MRSTLVAHCGTSKITREELSTIPAPATTKTHQPIAHHRIVEALVETLAFRHISVVRDEYAISADGMRMFGVMDLDAVWGGVGFSIGLRNSNDKTMRLGLTVGYRVFVCDNMAFSGDFSPAFHKHTKGLELADVISIAVDKLQRTFAPLKDQIEAWKAFLLSENDAKLIIYDAFRSKELRLPLRLFGSVHRQYFQPDHEEFQDPTLWSLSNAFTAAFKNLKPAQQFQTTAKLGGFLGRYSARGSTGERYEEAIGPPLALHA